MSDVSTFEACASLHYGKALLSLSLSIGMYSLRCPCFIALMASVLSLLQGRSVATSLRRTEVGSAIVKGFARE